jgi:hypothetical protein
MNYWSMYETQYLPVDYELSVKYPNAVTHDDVNIVFVEAPTDWTGAVVVDAGLSGDELMFTVGGHLVNETANPVIATKEQLVYLFKRPEHKLWCAKYESESDDSFIADKSAAGLDSGLTIAQAKQAIRDLVTP